MARVIREQTKEYSLPDQVKVNTPEKEKRFLEEKTNQKRFEEKKKTKGDKFRESIKGVTKLAKGGRVKKSSAGAAIRGKGCEIR